MRTILILEDGERRGVSEELLADVVIDAEGKVLKDRPGTAVSILTDLARRVIAFPGQAPTKPSSSKETR